MKVYNFINPGSTTAQENLELMTVLFSCLIQGIQGRPINPNEPFQIDDSVYNQLPAALKKFFRAV